MTKEKDLLFALGKRIDILRKEKDITFQELAHRSGIEKSNLVKLTTKDTNVTFITLNKIARGLDISVGELLDY